MGLITSVFGNKKVPRDPSFVSMVSAGDPWDLDFPLMSWGGYDHFTLRNALESVLIFGELGAAKTTGSAATLLLKYLEVGMGGLYCCVKPGDRELIEAYAKATGRSDSLIIVSPKHKNFCNLLRYILKRPGGAGSRVEQIVTLLMIIVEAAERSDRGRDQGQKFWQQSLRELLRNAIEVCIATRGDVTMSMVDEVIDSAPHSHEQVRDENWQRNSLCYQLIDSEGERERTPREQADFELAARYLLRKFPDLPPDTRGSVLATYGATSNVLLRGHMADIVNGETTNFVPEMTFEGAILVLDFPTKILGQSGVYLQTAITQLWMTACEQRDVKVNPRPVFFFCDEFHEQITNYTSEFMATSRSARVACLLISQNKPNYLAAMGGEAGRHRVDAFLNNAGTIIAHANGCGETNKWVSDKISEHVEIRHTFQVPENTAGPRGGGSESVGRKVLPSEFTMLKKGGPQNNFFTECLIYQTGAAFRANRGEPWLRAQFKQQIPGVTMDAKGGRR